MPSSLKVVFRSDVRGIAVAGDVKSVSSGYARNFLFPLKLAFAASEGGCPQNIPRGRPVESGQSGQCFLSGGDEVSCRTVGCRASIV